MTGRLPHGAHLLALVALLAALLAAGCGGEDGGTTEAGGPSPAALAPADSLVYGEALVRPDGDVEDGVVAAARKVLRVDDPGAELQRLIDRALRDEVSDEFSYARDVEPWLGDRVGVFASFPADSATESLGGVVIAARDRDALADVLDRLRDAGDVRPRGTYRGVAYDVDAESGDPNAIVDDCLVVASDLASFRAVVDASKDGGLADASRYEEAVDEVADDALGFLYFDARTLADQLRRRDDVGQQERRLLDATQLAEADPVVASLTASADEIAVESTADNRLADVASDSGGGGEVTVGQLPGDAWLALATPPIGPIVRQALETAGLRAQARTEVREALGLDLDRDLLDALGGLGLFARGSSLLDIGGGALLQLDSAASAQRLLTRIRAIVGVAADAPVRSVELDGARGFELQLPQSPQPIVVLAKGDRIAAGFAASSATDLLDPQQRFDESSAGKAAIATLGDGFTPSLVVLAPPIVNLLRSLDQLQVAELGDVLPYLSAYESLAVGTERDDDETTVRVVAALR